MALQQKTVLETITIRFKEDGTIQGIAAVDKVGIIDDATGAWVGATADGAAREIDLADLDAAAINPALSGQQATIAEQGAQITKLQALLAAAPAAPAAPATPGDNGGADALLDQLNAVFATIPAQYQAQFANEYATVRVLIQAGQPALAAAVVSGVEVPDELAPIKAQILVALQG